jgi:hypothetical protein
MPNNCITRRTVVFRGGGHVGPVSDVGTALSFGRHFIECKDLASAVCFFGSQTSRNVVDRRQTLQAKPSRILVGMELSTVMPREIATKGSPRSLAI